MHPNEDGHFRFMWDMKHKTSSSCDQDRSCQPTYLFSDPAVILLDWSMSSKIDPCFINTWTAGLWKINSILLILPNSTDGCFLYGVFNGYDGCRVANFVSQCLTAELLLGQLNSNHSDADVRRILTQVTGIFNHCRISHSRTRVAPESLSVSRLSVSWALGWIVSQSICQSVFY